jgi:NAD(P)-dependent dehydrogenase (short-subunit alcohol dehydrogenase family)
VAVITGAGGVLCSTLAHGLARAGVNLALLDLNFESVKKVVDEINVAGGKAIALECNVLDNESTKAAAQKIIDTFNRVDILINGAGGNKPQATTSATQTFFDIPPEAVQWVFNLNMIGTFLPCQVFGKIMANQGEGVILNISSMNGFRPLTRIPAYSAAKAAVSNFTQWLAVNLAQDFTPKIRVNAIAPGFFLTEQNRFLLTDKDTGELTTRGKAILSHTPQNRFGVPEDLIGTVLWLISPASEFVTGVVVPVDGGFAAYSGI